MDSHCKDGGEHQHLVGEHDPGPADDHDPDFGEFHDPDQARLIVIVRELTRKRRKKEEGQDEQRLRDGAEHELLRGILEQLIGDKQHHGLLEQAVVERSQELRRKQGQEPPRTQQMGDVLNQGSSVPEAMDVGPNA